MADDAYEAALSRTLWQQQEEQIVHNPYAHEQRKLDCIRRGDMAGLAACQTEKWTGQIGKVAETPLRPNCRATRPPTPAYAAPRHTSQRGCTSR